MKADSGKLVTFFRNGDFHYKGLQTSISKRQFPTLESLIIWLNEKIPMTSGVRHIYSLSTGRQIDQIDEIISKINYVVCSSRSADFGDGEKLYGNVVPVIWRNKAFSAGKIRRSENTLFYRPGDKKPSKSHSYPTSRAGSNHTQKYPAGIRPRMLTIRNNLHRNVVQKVILNPKTTQSFDGMIKDIGSMLQVTGEDTFTVNALYTAKPPYRKVFI